MTGGLDESLRHLHARRLRCIRCQPHGLAPPRSSSTGEAEGTIRSAREDWNAAFARRDTAALAAQWAPEGELIGGAGRWRGRDEIVRAFYAGLFQYRPDITFTREPTRIEGHEGAGLVYELGSWVERWSEPDGPTELRGAFFAMWDRRGGNWLKSAEIFVPAVCTGGAYCAPRPER
jgi:ketosteroid isomerase-like protein